MNRESIKKGISLICKKDFFYEDEMLDVFGKKIEGEPILIHILKYSNHYKVTMISATNNDVYIPGDNNIGMWFSVNGDLRKNPSIYEYFTTPAEWRDLQIDQILNDE
jgi:hypothetical protein